MVVQCWAVVAAIDQCGVQCFGVAAAAAAARLLLLWCVGKISITKGAYTCAAAAARDTPLSAHLHFATHFRAKNNSKPSIDISCNKNRQRSGATRI